MHPVLKDIVDEVLYETRATGIGAARDILNPQTLLQVKIVENDLEDDFTEDEFAEAAKAVGVPDAEIAGWLEGLASWYGD